MSHKDSTGQSKGIKWVIAVPALLAATVLFIMWTTHRAVLSMRNDLQLQARLVAETVNIENVRVLSGTEADLDVPD